MENNKIRELAGLMKEMDIISLEYQNGSESLKMVRPAENSLPGALDSNTSFTERKSEYTASGKSFTVKSPMVGVFYSAPGADEAPYAAVGDNVSVGDVLCVIEAMKIMNEITADRDGVITEIYAENRQVVEFGSPLFRISVL